MEKNIEKFVIQLIINFFNIYLCLTDFFSLKNMKIFKRGVTIGEILVTKVYNFAIWVQILRYQIYQINKINYVFLFLDFKTLIFTAI